MTTERDARAYLTDMLDASDKAMGFVRGMTYEEFTDDERTAFAVIRALEILGEAARHIPESMRRAYPDVPWQAAADMRNKLIHEYMQVSLPVVWKTVVRDLPSLSASIQRILSGLGDTGSSTER